MSAAYSNLTAAMNYDLLTRPTFKRSLQVVGNRHDLDVIDVLFQIGHPSIRSLFINEMRWSSCAVITMP